MKITMQTIAEAAGVSTMTVSRALRGDPSISPKTTQKITQLANELGYRSNPLVSLVMKHLRRDGTRGIHANLGFLCGSIKSNGWQERPFYREIFEGAQQQAERYGSRLDLIWIREAGLKENRINEILESRGIQGIIVGTWEGNLESLRLKWEKFSGIAIGYSVQAPLHRIASNQQQAMHLALNRLNELGYKRIGVIFSDLSDRRVNLSWSGSYYSYTTRLPKSRQLKPMILKDPELRNMRAFRQWFKSEKPDALLVQGGVLSKLQSEGISVPQDIALASLEPHSDSDDVAGIKRNFRLIGASALDLLITDMMSGAKEITENPRNTFIGTNWQDGVTAPDRSTRFGEDGHTYPND